MPAYDDTVLGAVPATFLIAIPLIAAGFNPSTAILPAAAAATVIILHALFVNPPTRRHDRP